MVDAVASNLVSYLEAPKMLMYNIIPTGLLLATGHWYANISDSPLIPSRPGVPWMTRYSTFNPLHL